MNRAEDSRRRSFLGRMIGAVAAAGLPWAAPGSRSPRSQTPTPG